MDLNFLKGKYGLQLIGFLFLAIICFFIFQLIGIAIVISVSDFNLSELTQPDLIEILIQERNGYLPIVILQIMQSIGLFIIPSIIFIGLMKKSKIDFLFFKKKYFFRFLVLLPLLAFAGVIVVGFLGRLNMNVKLPELLVDKENSLNKVIYFILSFRDLSHIVINVLLLAILPAIGEELFFRGVLQKVFISWTKKNWVGILITAFIFSAIHFQFLTFLPRFFMGVMLGYLLVWSKNIWIPIIAHFLHNFISIAIGISSSDKRIQEVETENYSFVIISILVISGIGYWYYLLSKKEHVS